MVAVTRTRRLVHLGPRLEALTNARVQEVYKEYPDLAGTDAVLKRAMQGWSHRAESMKTVDDLR